MTKRSRIQPGDIIGVPLAETLVAAGIVLHVSRYFTNGMMVGFYPQSFHAMEAINLQELGGAFFWTPNYTGKREITDGAWRIVGHSQELLAKATIPTLCVVNTLYYKDERVRQVSRSEAGKYPGLLTSEGGALENRLRKYFMQQTGS